jgi:hypothetical protein
MIPKSGHRFSDKIMLEQKKSKPAEADFRRFLLPENPADPLHVFA